jgi:hypothetical protein
VLTTAGSPPPSGGTTPVAPANRFTAPKPKLDHSGGISLAVDAPGAGKFTATAKTGSTTYGRASGTKHAKGRLTLKLKPTAAGKRALKKHTKLKLTVTITFTPTGGKPYSRKLTVTIKRA